MMLRSVIPSLPRCAWPSLAILSIVLSAPPSLPAQSNTPYRDLADIPFQNSEASGLAYATKLTFDKLPPQTSEAWWMVADEEKTPPAWLAVLHKTAGSWQALPVLADIQPVGSSTISNLDDAEALFRHGQHIYAIGSHFGKKMGPLEPKRGWIGRFDESHLRIDPSTGQAHIKFELANHDLLLHQLVNEALAALKTELPLNPLTPEEVTAFRVDPTVFSHSQQQRLAAGLARPFNIEGAALLDGKLWLGLRYPVSAKGEPILLRLSHWESLFQSHPATEPFIDAVAVAQGVGSPEAWRGIRDLASFGQPSTLLALAGNIDTPTKKFPRPVILEGRPAASAATTELFALTLKQIQPAASNKPAQFVAHLLRSYPPMPQSSQLNPEGIAVHPQTEAVRIVSDRSKGTIRIQAVGTK